MSSALNIQPNMKNCSVCKTDKPATTDHYPKDKNTRTGLRADCHECRRKRDSARHSSGSGIIQQRLEKYTADRAARAASIMGTEAIVEEFQSNVIPITVASGSKAIPTEAPVAKKAKKAKVVASVDDGTIAAFDGGVRSFVLLPDVHVPEHDRGFWSAFLPWLAETKPDTIVIMGDFLELSSCSQHGGQADIQKLEEDFAAGRQAIAELQEASPDSKIIYLEGNHETRLIRFLLSKAPSLIESLSVEAGLKLEEQGIPYFGERQQPVSFGRMDLVHGHQIASGKNSSLPKFHGGKVCDVYGQPGRVTVIGHSHREQVFTKALFRGNAKAVALGTMRLMDPEWLHGHNPGWSHQFAVAYVRPSGATSIYPVNYEENGFIWGGKFFGATNK